MNKLFAAMLSLSTIGFSTTAMADLITFDGLTAGEITQDFSSAGFNFSIDANNDGFENLNRSGSGTLESSGGISVLDITAVDGSDFQFESLVARNYGSQNAAMYWAGWNNDVQVFSQTSPWLSNTDFTVLPAFPLIDIDRLQLVFGPTPAQDEVIDGIHLSGGVSSVPEPSSFALLALTMLGLGSRRFNKR